MKPLLLTFFISISLTAVSQQDYLTTMFWNNYAVFNPATSGLEYKHQAALSYRRQWVGIDGAPKTLFGNYNTRIGRHHGVGGHYSFDEIGNMKSHFFHLNYNYQFIIDESRRISFGISPGFTHISFIDDWIPPTTAPVDPFLPVSTSNMSFNGGVAYKGKSIYAGVGVTHFVELFHRNEINTFDVAPHYYAHVRVKKQLTQKSILYLEGLFRTDLIKYTFDLNARFRLFNRLTLGVGYRFIESLSATIGWDFNEKYRIGYAFDWPHVDSKLVPATGRSHEFTIGYLIPYPKQTFQNTGLPISK